MSSPAQTDYYRQQCKFIYVLVLPLKLAFINDMNTIQRFILVSISFAFALLFFVTMKCFVFKQLGMSIFGLKFIENSQTDKIFETKTKHLNYCIATTHRNKQ